MTGASENRTATPENFISALLSWTIRLVILATLFLPEDLQAAWLEIPLVDMHGKLFSASSELNRPPAGGVGRYGPHNLFDKDPATCWAEGVSGNGIDEALFVGIGKGRQALFVRNGYTKSRALFAKNGRINTLAVSLLLGFNPPGHVSEQHIVFHTLPLSDPFAVTLKDSMDIQHLPLAIEWPKITEFEAAFIDKAAARLRSLKIPFSRQDIVRQYILRLEIRDVYPGSKYTDTCLSEVRLQEQPARIYVSAEEDAILVDSDLRKQQVLIKDGNAVFLIIEQTEDNMWLIAHKMPRQGVGVSVEVEEMLFHVASGRRVVPELLGSEYPQLFGFKDGVLQYSRSPMAPEEQISLKLLLRKMSQTK